MEFFTVIALIAISVALSIPSVARLPRAYFDGKDHDEWAEVLESGDVQNRQQAITALCEILKEKKNQRSFSVFGVSVYALGKAKAKEALPALYELLGSLESGHNKGAVKDAIEMIERRK